MKVWHKTVGLVIAGLIVAGCLGIQAVIMLWSVRALGWELPIDAHRVAAVTALLSLFYGTLQLVIVWRK